MAMITADVRGAFLGEPSSPTWCSRGTNGSVRIFWRSTDSIESHVATITFTDLANAQVPELTAAGFEPASNRSTIVWDSRAGIDPRGHGEEAPTRPFHRLPHCTAASRCELALPLTDRYTSRDSPSQRRGATGAAAFAPSVIIESGRPVRKDDRAVVMPR